MTITKELELVPFSIPNFVIAKMPPRPRQEGMAESPKFNLSEVSSEELAKLCDQFRRDIFQKANKRDPNAEGTND